MPIEPDVTALLDRARGGDADAFDELVGEIYHELRAIARGKRRRLRASDTVNTTAIVHEAYAKMAGAIGRNGVSVFVDRGHFFRTAASVMRDVIVDYARAQSTQKRGGPEPTLRFGGMQGVPEKPAGTIDPSEVLSVHSALERLKTIDEEAARVTELRYFAGLTTEETAEALGISPATVKRRWTVARAWLDHELSDETPRKGS